MCDGGVVAGGWRIVGDGSPRLNRETGLCCGWDGFRGFRGWRVASGVVSCGVVAGR